MDRKSLVLVLGVCLMGCGGGRVSLQLTDAPPDKDNMQEVWVALSRVEAHVVDRMTPEDGDPDNTAIDDDARWHSATPEEREYDLLRLQNDTTAALADLDLPEGKITQIRLFIDENGRNEIVLKDGRECALDLREVDRRGIKINHPFKALDVTADNELNVVIDFDLMESISKEGDCDYRLQPVIKIKRSGRGGGKP